MNIEKILEKRKVDFPKVSLSDNVQETVQLFNHHAYHAAIVVDEAQNLCGIVTEYDLVCAFGDHGEKAKTVLIESVMSFDLIICTPDTPIQEAMKLMSDNKVHHLPVVDESGHMSGFVGMMELMLSYIEPV